MLSLGKGFLGLCKRFSEIFAFFNKLEFLLMANVSFKDCRKGFSKVHPRGFRTDFVEKIE